MTRTIDRSRRGLLVGGAAFPAPRHVAAQIAPADTPPVFVVQAGGDMVAPVSDSLALHTVRGIFHG